MLVYRRSLRYSAAGEADRWCPACWLDFSIKAELRFKLMNPPPAIWSSPQMPSPGSTVLCQRSAWAQPGIRLHVGGSIRCHRDSRIRLHRRMREDRDQCNKRERGDTRYQLEN
jgi:hypothetical protein